jgi:hypothetical protein
MVTHCVAMASANPVISCPLSGMLPFALPPLLAAPVAVALD